MDLDRNIDDVFQLVNRVRSNPGEFVGKYASDADRYEGKIFKESIKTREGVEALNDLFQDLKSRNRVEHALKWCFGLHMVADAQAKKLGMGGLLTTDGSTDHRALPQRVKDYAVVKGKISEVCEFGGSTGEQVVEWLLIDDGLSSRKRRLTLLNPVFNYIGIGCCLHKVHGFVTVIVLAEDVVSLVAPGSEGQYIKREAGRQQKLREFVVQEKKKNERVIEKMGLEYSTVNRGVGARMVTSNIVRQ